MNKKDQSKPENNDPLASLANVVWYGVGMACVCLIFGVPYLLFWDSLPSVVKLWLDPRLLILVVVIIGIAFTMLVKKLLKR